MEQLVPPVTWRRGAEGEPLVLLEVHARSGYARHILLARTSSAATVSRETPPALTGRSVGHCPGPAYVSTVTTHSTAPSAMPEGVLTHGARHGQRARRRQASSGVQRALSTRRVTMHPPGSTRRPQRARRTAAAAPPASARPVRFRNALSPPATTRTRIDSHDAIAPDEPDSRRARHAGRSVGTIASRHSGDARIA